MSIQSKLLLVVLPLVVAPLICAGWVAHWQLRDISSKTLRDELESVIGQNQRIVATTFETARANVSVFAHSALVGEFLLAGDKTERYRSTRSLLLHEFAGYRHAYPIYKEIRVLLPNGLEALRLAEAGITNTSEDESGSAFFRDLQRSQAQVYSGLHRIPDDGSTSLVVAEPIKLTDNRGHSHSARTTLRGYLAVTVDLTLLQDLAIAGTVGAGGCIFFADGEGNIVFHHTPEQAGTRLSADLVQEMHRLAEVATAARHDGHGPTEVSNGLSPSDVLAPVSYNDMPVLMRVEEVHPHLFLIGMLPQAEMLAASRSMSGAVAVLTLATVLATALLLVLVLRRLIVRPLLRLNETAHEMGRGNLLASAPVGTNDEVGQLARSFAGMGRNLHQARSELQDRTHELEVAKEEFEDFANIASDWFWKMDADLRFSYFSEPFFTVTGVAPEQLLGKTREETGIPEVEPAAWRQHLADLHAHRPFRNFVHSRFRPDGEVVWVSISATPIFDAQGRFAGYRGTGSNITELKKAQETAEAARREAERASQAKSRFLAHMSHEIRTPINGVIGTADLLSRTDLSDDQRGSVEVIRRSGKLLTTVINDILDFSKIEAGKLKLEDQPFSVAELIANTERVFLAQAKEKGLALSCRLPDDLPQVVHGDQTRVGQILINLLGNAIKFTERGGVELTVSRGDDDGDAVRLRFEVSDSGIGIDPDMQTRIFSAFAQADDSTTRSYGGTGLGLSICRQLADLMGGEIGLESTPGRGSRFWFTVPLAKAAAEAPDGQPSRRGQAAAADRFDHDDTTGHDATAVLRGRVLLAEDNPVNQDIARAMLESLGCRVDLAGSGISALEVLARGNHDVVLMDCDMPDMDGYEATRKIREREIRQSAARRVPIIAQTASAFEEDRQRCLAAGMDGYISKPFDQDDLYAALKAWLQPAPDDHEDAVADQAPPDQPRSGTHLDGAVLDRIRALRDGLLEQVIRTYLDQAPAQVAALDEALVREDGEALRHAAHKLKSSSANLGAVKLAALIKQLEQMSCARDLSSARDLLGEINCLSAMVCEELEAELAAPPEPEELAS